MKVIIKTIKLYQVIKYLESFRINVALNQFFSIKKDVLLCIIFFSYYSSIVFFEFILVFRN